MNGPWVLPGSGMESGVQLITGGAGPVYCSLPEMPDGAARGQDSAL